MIKAAAILLASMISAGLAPPTIERSAPAPVKSVSREEIASLPTARSVGDLLRVCPARTIPAVGSPSQAGSVAPLAAAPSCVQPEDLRMVDIYRAHNFARAQVGAPPLVWDLQLARDANLYAQEMARTGQLVHSSRDNRRLVRENLMRVPRGWNPQQMMGLWLSERQNLVPGIFPNVSRTGNWGDIAHYTQMVWSTTTNLGCAIQRSGAFDWVICRYSPPGNRDGTAIGPGGIVTARPR